MAALTCNFGSGRHQFLGIRCLQCLEAVLQNFSEAPTDDALPVYQELTDKLSLAGSHCLLIGFRDLISFFLLRNSSIAMTPIGSGNSPGSWIRIAMNVSIPTARKPNARCEARARSDAARRSGIGW